MRHSYVCVTVWNEEIKDTADIHTLNLNLNKKTFSPNEDKKLLLAIECTLSHNIILYIFFIINDILEYVINIRN